MKSKIIKDLIEKYPQNKKQLLNDNAWNIQAFGINIWTFSDGSTLKEAI